MLDKHLANELLDFYEKLLTPRQREVWDYYFRQDLSLFEIAEYLKISKAAVSDIIRRVQSSLLFYEEQLQLVKKHKKRLELLRQHPELKKQMLAIEEEEYD